MFCDVGAGGIGDREVPIGLEVKGKGVVVRESRYSKALAELEAMRIGKSR